MRIVIVGIGRLGGTLLVLLQRAGVDVVGWKRGEVMPAGDVFWVTVKDAAIEEVSALIPPDAMVLHASGARGLEALPHHVRRGVLHPLMTFPGIAFGIPNLSGVPASVRGEGEVRDAAMVLCSCLGMNPFVVVGDPRLYHAAAVLASSHLASVFLSASEVLASLGVAPDVARDALLPLARASLERAAQSGTAALTGPTARGDLATVAGHREALSCELLALYDATRQRQLELLGR